MEADELRDAIRKWTKVGTALEKAEAKECYALAAGGSDLLRSDRESLLRVATESCQPVMHCYMSDGWKSKSKTVQNIYCNGKLKKRGGSLYNEYLMELDILKTIPGDEEITMAFPVPDMKLLGDKGGWSVFQRS